MKNLMIVIGMIFVFGFTSCSSEKKIDPQMELYKMELKKKYDKDCDESKSLCSGTKLKMRLEYLNKQYRIDTTNCNK